MSKRLWCSRQRPVWIDLSPDSRSSRSSSRQRDETPLCTICSSEPCRAKRGDVTGPFPLDRRKVLDRISGTFAVTVREPVSAELLAAQRQAREEDRVTKVL